MQRLLLLGLNHTTAPLELREKLAFNSEQRAAALADLKSRFSSIEAVLLSTCNRVELYVSRSPHEPPSVSELLAFLAESRGLTASAIQPHLYDKSERRVVEHLFRVATSLDSMVLGETQILGQVREAYESARESGSAGAMLHPLFQRALSVGKQIMSETALGEGRVSVAAIAVQYARQIFETFTDKTVLSIGAGKMATLVLGNLAQLAPKKLLICNRDPNKASGLADRFSGNAVPFEQLSDHLAAADIVVTSTGAPRPIIDRTMFESVMRRRRQKPVFLIDIALPRDIDAEVGKLENVYLYNLDDLQNVAAAAQANRSAAAKHADIIIQQHVEQFIAWNRTRQLGPLIEQLYKKAHALAQDELSRTLGKLGNIGESERSHLEDLTRRIVNKLLHDPIQVMREGDGQHSQPQRYAHAMEKLFKLESAQFEPSADALPPEENDDGNQKSV